MQKFFRRKRVWGGWGVGGRDPLSREQKGVPSPKKRRRPRPPAPQETCGIDSGARGPSPKNQRVPQKNLAPGSGEEGHKIGGQLVQALFRRAAAALDGQFGVHDHAQAAGQGGGAQTAGQLLLGTGLGGMEADLLARAGLPELAELAGQQGEQGKSRPSTSLRPRASSFQTAARLPASIWRMQAKMLHSGPRNWWPACPW